jgi:hypothetical protein
VAVDDEVVRADRRVGALAGENAEVVAAIGLAGLAIAEVFLGTGGERTERADRPVTVVRPVEPVTLAGRARDALRIRS